MHSLFASRFKGLALAAAATYTRWNCSVAKHSAREDGKDTHPHDKPLQKALVLVAMDQEARPFVERHGLQEIEPPWSSNLPMVGYHGVVGGMECILVWAGTDRRYKVNNVATTASAVSAYASVVAFSPDIVISAGTAGGFGAMGAQSQSYVGDVYLSTKCIFHHRRIPNDMEDAAEFGDYGLGNFRCPPMGRLAQHTGCKLGVISTSDSLGYTIEDLEVMLAEGASVKEMEAASIAWVCQQLLVPFVAVKSITDIVDGERSTQEEFWSNLDLASSALQSKLTLLLESMNGKPLRHWRLRSE
mmetsp:Transcript_16131/g.31524  ORF Transcript_16131/g.31524 Transcript_16131/m.31524 type:complete len:301 (+) Transcript_16131:121-1023(+)